MVIKAEYTRHFQDLNEAIRQADDSQITINPCMGQRYIASGSSGKEISIYGTPGNALGAYLNGSRIEVFGNVQDATGDTMNDGEIIVHGSAGDAPGYGMRGGCILVEQNAGYRAGIHMKSYKDKIPSLIIGGCAGSFLGEYLAGGVIVVLGLGADQTPIAGNFCGTGMHGGKIILRTDTLPADLPEQVSAHKAEGAELAEIKGYVARYEAAFEVDLTDAFEQAFWILIPNAKNPYHQLYTQQ